MPAAVPDRPRWRTPLLGMLLAWSLIVSGAALMQRINDRTLGPALARGDWQAPRGAIPVKLIRTDAGWQLLRDGQPYFIRGVGGTTALEELAARGGNSIRTWGADGLDELLDAAHRLNLTVTVGIWLGHKRHGFDYTNTEHVIKQTQQVRDTILRYRDHPAVLMWGLGNEMEGEGDNAAVWLAVNQLAQMVKRLDPHHPVMTVVAEIGSQRVPHMQQLCPDIDIIGINSYGGGPSLGKRFKRAGGVRPYIITEFGPPGPWEADTTEWGEPIGMSTTAKAEHYRQTYQRSVLAQPGLCLGSYAFLWGWKQEGTATWFGMFLPDHSRLEAVDAMGELWSGHAPDNRCPRIANLRIEGSNQCAAGSVVRALVELTDPENDTLRVQWFLREAAKEYVTGGDAQQPNREFPEAILASDHTGCTFRLPDAPGPYRLFVYAYDPAGGAVTDNVCVLVQGSALDPGVNAPAPAAP